ncbi:MAG: hypothetical protein ACKO7N_09715, partial [Candidatus Nitrosotenuis sp.]
MNINYALVMLSVVTILFISSNGIQNADAASVTKYSGTQTGWSSPTNAAADDSFCATTSSNSATLDLTNFAFSIPSDATITALTADFLYFDSAGGNTATIQMIHNNVVIGTSKSFGTSNSACNSG